MINLLKLCKVKKKKKNQFFKWELPGQNTKGHWASLLLSQSFWCTVIFTLLDCVDQRQQKTLKQTKTQTKNHKQTKKRLPKKPTTKKPKTTTTTTKHRDVYEQITTNQFYLVSEKNHKSWLVTQIFEGFSQDSSSQIKILHTKLTRNEDLRLKMQTVNWEVCFQMTKSPTLQSWEIASFVK